MTETDTDMRHDDLVTHADIAEMLGVAKRTPRQWRYIALTSSPGRQQPVMPDPVAESKSGALLFDREQILAWAADTDRRVRHAHAGGRHMVKSWL